MSGEQTIRRGVRNGRYAAIPNHVFEDDRLSMEARWLLGYLLSKPDNWTVVIGDIVNRGKCGRDKARKMIAELVLHGYAEREQTRDDGKFGASVLVIFDEPRMTAITVDEDSQEAETHAENATVAFLPQTDLPATAKPSPVLPAPVKSAHSNNSYLANPDDSKERERRERGAHGQEDNPKDLLKRVRAMEFGKANNPWPGAKGSSTEWAARQFAALSEDERRMAEERRDAYLAECERERVKPVALGVYFRDRKFEGVNPQAQTAAPKLAGGRVAVPVLGPVWAVSAFLPLMRKPARIDLKPDHRTNVLATYEAHLRRNPIKARDYLAGKGIDLDVDGQPVFPEFFERDELRRLVMSDGYPETKRLYEAVAQRGHVTVDAGMEALKGLMEAVPVGSDTFEAWRAFYAGRFIPFLPDLGQMPVAYFPRGGPEGLDDFLNQVAATQNEAGDDAA